MKNDYELLYYHHGLCEDSMKLITQKYTPMIWKIIGSFNTADYSNELEDMYQLCVYELYKAMNCFDESKGVNFRTYYYTCARRCVLNYIISENHKSLYQIKKAASLDGEIQEESGLYLCEIIAILMKMLIHY